MKKIILASVMVLLCSFNAYANSALLFDGNNDYVKIPDSNNWDIFASLSSNRTIEFQFNMSKIPSEAEQYDVFVGQFRDQMAFPPNDCWEIVIDNSNYLQFRAKGQDNWLGSCTTPSGIIIPNKWYHAALIKSGSSVQFFLDGVGSISKSLSGTVSLNVPLEFGRNQDSGGWGYLDGKLDEIRIWDYAMTQSEVNYWMQNTPSGSDPHLLGYWNFDEGSGQIVHDLTSYGNDGQLGGTLDAGTDDPVWVTSDRQVIPEPSTFILLSAGFLGAVLFRRKRSRK